ncbi:MAG: efflux RND transporter periplasmic adaptor subunit [Chloroflexia bacterium]
MGLVLALAAGLLYLFLLRPTPPPYVVVRRGAIRGTVSAFGEVISTRQAVLASPVSGQVVEVPVKVGQEVVTGTLLVRLSSEGLEYRVEEARLRLEIAQLHLQEAREGASPEEIAAAQAELAAAEARLAALLAGARPEEVAVARQEVVQAEAALKQARESSALAVESARLNWEVAANALRNAQDAYSRIYWENERLRQRGIPLPQAQQDAETLAWRQVEDAEDAMEQARLAYERARQEQEAAVTEAQARLTAARAHLQGLLSGPEEAARAEAEARVAQARANLSRLQAGSDSIQVQILERELFLAQLSLEQARAELDKTRLLAPFAGTVVELAADEGEVVGAYSSLVRLADLRQLQIRARIDEIDVGWVSPGQAVTVTLDAFPGRPLRGTVQEIAPAVTIDRGTPYYLTTIALRPPLPVTLRLGMAANLTIVTVEKEDALLIPRQAVERIGEGYYVTVLREGRSERVRITLGVADPQYYEVLSGLEEGERVLMRPWG